MTKIKVEGKVDSVGQVKAFGSKGFKKCEVIVEVDNGRYSSYLPVEFTGDAADQAAFDIAAGDSISLEGFVTGRKWQRDPSSEVKVFLSIQASAFSVTKGEGESSDTVSQGSADEDSIPF